MQDFIDKLSTGILFAVIGAISGVVFAVLVFFAPQENTLVFGFTFLVFAVSAVCWIAHIIYAVFEKA